jgi:PAS domain S-box-containing protein
MEQKYTGEGYLKGPLEEVGTRLAALNKEAPHLTALNEIQKYFQLLEFNINELNELINTFREQLREGCMLVQDSKIFWANKAAVDISGYKQDELTGKLLIELTVPTMRDKLAARNKMLLAVDKLGFPEEWPLLKADRTVVWVNVFAYRVTFLKNVAVLMFFYDITESKRIQEEQKMRAEMMDAINDGVFLMEMSGNIVYANESFCSIAGYSREEILKKNILDVTAPEVRKRYDIRMKQFSTHKDARFTTTALSKDGSRIEVEVRGRIIMNGGKQRVLGVARAIRTDKEPDIDSIKTTN